MRDYKNGKIYKLICNTSGKTYYGSTCFELHLRLQQHISNSKCSSYEIIKNKNYEIILVEKYPSNNKDELLKRERFYIENNDCVNRNIPTRTELEHRQEHRGECRIRSKEWRKKNPDKFKKQMDDYRHLNRDKLISYKKKVYHYRNSWGGDERRYNNLLRIDINLFN